MTKQETLERLKNLYDVVEQLQENAYVLTAQVSFEKERGSIHLFVDDGGDIPGLNDKTPYGEYDNGNKCIKHSSRIDGVDVFFLEEAQHG